MKFLFLLRGCLLHRVVGVRSESALQEDGFAPPGCFPPLDVVGGEVVAAAAPPIGSQLP